MEDRELKLYKRKKSALVKTIEKNVFVVVDESLKKKEEAVASRILTWGVKTLVGC